MLSSTTSAGLLEKPGQEAQGRKLVPNPREAELVCRIFSLYIQLGCVRKLAKQLDREKIRSKVWATRTGVRLGGVAFARGALYDLLRNRLYLGEIRHRDQWYRGEHKGIIPLELWQKVQSQLDSNRKTRRKRVRECASSLLTGLIEDAQGHRLTPSFTIRRGRRYRYYVSQAVIANPGEQHSGVTRLPAHEIESCVIERLVGFLKSDTDVFDGLGVDGQTPVQLRAHLTGTKKLADKLSSLPADDLRDLLSSFLRRVVVGKEQIQVLISRNDLWQLFKNDGKAIASNLSEVRKPVDPSDLICLSIEARMKRYGGMVHLVVPPNAIAPVAHPKLPLIKAIARAYGWYEKVIRGEAFDIKSLARKAGLSERYVGKVFGCAVLAPDIIESILDGHQPYDLTFQKLCQDIPLNWADQREQFGFAPLASSRRPIRSSLN